MMKNLGVLTRMTEIHNAFNNPQHNQGSVSEAIICSD